MNEKSKRIAKNTVLLYIRMAITMIVSLFTSRIILDSLGVEDYGIYNVVAGVVAMFGFFSGSLSSAISRYLNFEMGKGYSEKLAVTFSTGLSIMLCLAVVMAIMLEVVGVWFLNYKLNIPADRMDAANWVIHFAVLIFLCSIVRVPFNAAIIAHERMDVYAYISIFEVVAKLGVSYMIYTTTYDKLIYYSVLLFLIAVLVLIGYAVFCFCKFKECRIRLTYDKSLVKELTGFAGWNLLGSAAYIFNTQGVNIATNLFFGVTVNTARGITTQVESAVKQFVTSFTTALNPQITQSYAAGNIEYMNKLVCRGAKYSFFLMLMIAVPVFFEADSLLHLWLKQVPEYTVIFVRLTLIGSMVDLLGNSTANACWATGKVRMYYTYVASFGCLPFFLSLAGFYLGMPPYWAYISFILVYTILSWIKVWVIKRLMNFPAKMYYKEVYARVVPVALLSCVVPFAICFFCPQSFVRMIVVGILGILSVFASVYLIGLEKDERTMIVNNVYSKIIKKNK